ncbi:hypothetical protein ACFTY7_08285, partial [Streptomyces sp. NPDC057062]
GDPRPLPPGGGGPLWRVCGALPPGARRRASAQEYVSTQHVDLPHREDTTVNSPGRREEHEAQAVGRTRLQPAAPPAPRARRRGRTVALVLAVAAVVGAAGAVAVNWFADRDTGTGLSVGSTSTSTSTSASPAQGSQQAGSGLPDGWVRKKDPVAGFTIALPGKQWKRKKYDSFQTDYTPDGGRHFIRIAIDDSPDFDESYEHQVDLEQQIQGLTDYNRVTLHKNIYRDCPGSEWEFTFTAVTPFPGPRHDIEETYIGRNGVEYAIYMSGPAEDWDTMRKQFDVLLRAWRQPTG